MDFEVAWFRKLFLLSSMIHGFIIRKLVGLRATFTLLSRCFFQKQLPEVFLEISQNSQENNATLLKKWLWHRCLPVNFAKFLRTPFLDNTSGRLLLFFSEKFIFANLTLKRLQVWVNPYYQQTMSFAQYIEVFLNPMLRGQITSTSDLYWQNSLCCINSREIGISSCEVG